MARPPPTLTVSTVNLSADLKAADRSFGPENRGALPPEELAQLLEIFRDLDEGDNQTHEPMVKVSSPQGEFSVRLSMGKLFLYNPHEINQSPVELDIPGLMEVFIGSELEDLGSNETDIAPPPAGAKWRAVIGASLLVFGLGLSGRAIYMHFQPDPVWPPPAQIKVVTDPVVLAQHATELAGSYATGSGAGQRIILIHPDQKLTFQLMGSGGPETIIREFHATYTLGKLGQKIQLITQQYGVVEVQTDGSLIHSGDLYRRNATAE